MCRQISALALAITCGCGPGMRPAVTPPADPTPLAKCKVAASHESPLVTEWPASAKARLESLLGARAVAVAYSGCELRIADECSVPGQYRWRRTTLSTDTVEIQDADELWAKLPLGAAALEGELGRSGRLAVRTTVSGQLQLESTPELPSDGSCANVTHIVSAISVGAFRMVSGGAAHASGGASTPLGGLGGQTRREESLLREAGDPERCRETSDTAASPDCGSPIQLFLLPVRAPKAAPAPASPQGVATTGGAAPDDTAQAIDLADARARQRGVLVSLPAREDEQWSLHDADGNRLCTLPCERWIAPRSGYYIERDQTQGRRRTRIDIPNELPHDPGTRVTAEFAPERGSPFWSSVTFFALGIPLGIGAVATLVIGLVDSDHRSFLLTASGFYAVGAAGSTYWYLHSRPDTFTTYASGRQDTGLRFGPGFVTGTF